MGTPALRIGTEHAGTGVARAVSIVTGGTERLMFASGGLRCRHRVRHEFVDDRQRPSTNHQTGWLSSAASSTTLDLRMWDCTPRSQHPRHHQRQHRSWHLAIDKVQGTPFERLKMEWDTTNHVARIGTSKGTGGTARDLAFITDDQVRMTIYAAADSTSLVGSLLGPRSTSGPIRMTTSSPPAAGATGMRVSSPGTQDFCTSAPLQILGRELQLLLGKGNSSWQ